MAHKGLKITDSIANPVGGTNLTATFVIIQSTTTYWGEDKTVEAMVQYFRNEADCDAGKAELPGFTKSFRLTVTGADWDNNTKGPNDRIVEALKTKLEETYTTVTLIAKA